MAITSVQFLAEPRQGKRVEMLVSGQRQTSSPVRSVYRDPGPPQSFRAETTSGSIYIGPIYSNQQTAVITPQPAPPANQQMNVPYVRPIANRWDWTAAWLGLLFGVLSFLAGAIIYGTSRDDERKSFGWSMMVTAGIVVTIQIIALAVLWGTILAAIARNWPGRGPVG